MLTTRVIPCLLLKDGGLVKTVRFRDPVYVGDPINAVKIFNDKEVHELAVLDIEASRQGRGPDFGLLTRIAREAFMPMAYGGGLRTADDVRRVVELGFEKAVINTSALADISFLSRAAELCGAQSVVAAVDVKTDLLGRRWVFAHVSGRRCKWSPVEYAAAAERSGAGEILLTSVDRDGTQRGYDLDSIREVSRAVAVPVIACGGAGRVEDFARAAEAGAAAAAAGSLFVFHGRHRAVLITYPTQTALREAFARPVGNG
jgi:cyclase